VYERARDRDPALVAYHAERGKNLTRAATAYAEAAEQARNLGDHTLSVVHARRGIACGPDAPTLGALRFEEAKGLLVAGALAEATTRAQEALAMIARGTTRWVLTVQVLADVAGRRSDVPALLELLPPLADAVLEGPHVEGPRFRALCAIANWLVTLGAAREAEPVHREVERCASRFTLSDHERGTLHHLRGSSRSTAASGAP